jgi:hypothetical protein
MTTGNTFPMLPLLAALVLWIPSVLGWGIPWVLFRQRVSGTSRIPVDLVEPIWGLAMLAGLATWINLWLPIDDRVVWAVWVAGLALLAVRVRVCGWPRLSLWLVAAALAWLVVVAFIGNRPPVIYDSGLYYLQSMAWIRTARALPGLANLHGRFGFSPLWFPLATLLQPLGARAYTALSANLLSSLLFWLVGLAGWIGLRKVVAGQWTQTNVFLALSLFALTSSLASESITSPSADWAVVLLALIGVSVFLQFQDQTWSLAVGLGALGLLALFAVAIKLSAIPLLLFPVAMVIGGRTQLKSVKWAPLLSLAVGLSAWLIIPGLIRSVMISGCLAYPVSLTCLSQLPWRVPISDVRTEAGWILSWARWPGPHQDITLTGWGWLQPWWEQTRTQADLYGPFGLMIAEGVVLAISVRTHRQAAKQAATRLQSGWPLLAGLTFWFLTAPDPRFGAGYWWGLGLLAASAGVIQLLQDPPPYLVARRLRLGSSILLSVVAGVSMMTMVLSPVSYWLTSTPAILWWQWPTIPSVPLTRKFTEDGMAVWVPVSPGDQCWLAPLPCVVALQPHLRIHLDSSGHYQWFEVLE